MTDSRSSEDNYEMGKIYHRNCELEKAILFYTKALAINPSLVEAHYSLGVALKEKGSLDSAIDSYTKAIRINPNYPNLHYALGNLFKEKGNIKTAIEYYQNAIFLKGDHADAYWNLAQAQLLSEDYKNGLENYEWRWKKIDYSKPHATPKSSLWDGSALVNGEKLLIVSEQGLGDTIQFMRYILHLNNQGIETLFSAQSSLHSLIKVSGINQFPLTLEQANEISDIKWIPLLSLPRFLKVTPKNPQINHPYISTSKELILKWREILSIETRPIIGLNWQGNPQAELNNLKGRSLPLEKFSKLVDRNKISLISLQKGFGSDQIENCSFKDSFVTCQKRINQTWDFLETSAIIANCDLIITSDTCIAHLAGAMGKRTWLLLKHVPDWRWGMFKASTFWYPSINIFRQNERHNWDEVLERVANKLQRSLKTFVLNDNKARREIFDLDTKEVTILG